MSVKFGTAKKKTKQLPAIELSPTQEDFVFSEAVVNIIYSGYGEGKTYACVIALLQHAKRNGKPIRCAIVRDTHENIKISTARSIQEALNTISPNLCRFKNDYKELTIFSKPRIDVDLFGIDDPAALSKLQGPEYALIWLEEPAPMSDKSNAGLSEEVFNAALARCARQKDAIPRLQVSMNPADEDHWTYHRFFEEPAIDIENPLITRAIFRIPYGENTKLAEVARQAAKSAYKHDKASFSRYVEGRFASVYRGIRVTPDYDPEKYLSKSFLYPVEGLEGFRLYDGWHNPSMILGQVTSIGRLVFLDTIRLENSDIKTLIENKALPLLNSPRWKGKCKSWRDIGDRSMRTPDQSNRQESAAKVIEKAFNTFFEPGPARWEHIKQGINSVFNRNIHGMPAFVINPGERLLHKALSGGWHYKTDNNGNVISNVPEKTELSHIGDAFANGVNVLLPNIPAKPNTAAMRRMSIRNKTRVESYAF